MSLAEPDLDPSAPQGNARAYSVSELSFALKRTLEDAYGFVRLRGELSKVTFHSNGHVYLSLKDERACIDGVVWKGNVRTLGVLGGVLGHQVLLRLQGKRAPRTGCSRLGRALAQAFGDGRVDRAHRRGGALRMGPHPRRDGQEVRARRR